MSLEVPGLERRSVEDPFNYTDDQRLQKRLALKTMRDLYPTVSPLHAEWVYDLCMNNSEEEVQRIMKQCDETPSRFVTCNDPSSELYQKNIDP